MIKSKHKGCSTAKVKNSIKYGILVLFAVVTLLPLLWVILSSLKSTNEIFGDPFGLPEIIRLGNYLIAWHKANIGLYFLNSVKVCVIAVFVLIIVSSMAAYILARIWKNFIMYTYFAIGLTIPVHTIIIPTFIISTKLNIYNTHVGLIIFYIVSNLSLGIFIMTGFLKEFPKEIEEAALIDGCSMTRTFFTIVFPLSKHGISTIGILGFLYTWNDFIMANVLISKDKLKTITMGIQSLDGTFHTDYGPLFAGLVISIIPVVVVYIIFQEQVIEGMTAGAVKG